MPEDNKDAYKEMYEMGERLIQMAKDGGYSPDSEDSFEEKSEYGGDTSQGDKVKSALTLFGNG